MAASLNPYISHFGEEFDAEKSSHYRMAIQFALGGLSFALLDTTSQTLVGFEHYQSDLLADSNDLFRTLERALESKGLNNKPLHSVLCIVDNRYCTLVPQSLFDENDLAKYLDFGFQAPKGYAIASEMIKQAQCHNVFAWPKTLHDMVKSKWGKAAITQSISVLIDTIMTSDPQTGVFVHVHNRDFDLVMKKDGNLHFFNNFKFVTKEDFAYFLLFAMEQNGLSGQDTPVCFSGLIRPASEIVDLCSRYIKNIRFVANPHTLSVSKALDDVPFQYYFIHYQTFTKPTFGQQLS